MLLCVLLRRKCISFENGGDLYVLAKILAHSNIKMTERYAKLTRRHIAKTGDTARRMSTLMEGAEPAQMRTSAQDVPFLYPGWFWEVLSRR